MFTVTLGLQSLRRQVSAEAYASIWFVLMIACVPWGGWALLNYVTRYYHWQRAIPFLPGLVAFAIAAKLCPRRGLARYFGWLILFVVVLCGCLTIMEHFDVWTRLLGLPPLKSGGPFMGAGGEVVDELRWYFIGSPGIAMLTAVLFVPPKFFVADGVFPFRLPRIDKERQE